ncbi:MAG TPA: type II secretion system protein GspL [Candidatus Binataceae bacterium]
MAQRILALEIAGDKVRAAIAERTWNSFDLSTVVEQTRAQDEPDLSAAIARLIERVGKPDIVISALPSNMVAKRLLELPFSDSRRLHQVVPFALEEHLPFPVDGAVVAFSRVGQEGDNTLVMAAFARRVDLEQHLALLARGGLDPKTVTLAPLALAALYGRARNGTARGPHLVLGADPGSTSIVLLDLAGAPRAMRTVGAGLVMVDGSPSPHSQSNAVLNTVRQTLLANADLEHPDLILTGPGSATPKVKSLLVDALTIAVRDGGDFDYSSVFGNSAPDAPRYAGCVAMLLSEMPVKPVDLLNFRQGEFAFHGRIRGDLTHFHTLGRLAAVVAALMVLHFSLGLWTDIHRLNVLNSQIAAIAAPALGDQVSGAEAKDQLRSQIIKMNKRLKLLGGNYSRNSPLDALLAVSNALPERYPVEMQDVQIDEGGLKVSGQADSFASVDQAKQELTKGGFFGPIEVTHAKAGSDPGKVEFLLDASFKDVIAGTE